MVAVVLRGINLNRKGDVVAVYMTYGVYTYRIYKQFVSINITPIHADNTVYSIYHSRVLSFSLSLSLSLSLCLPLFPRAVITYRHRFKGLT